MHKRNAFSGREGDECLHYALTRPAVAMVISGAHTVEKLMESVSYKTAMDDQRDYATAFTAFPKINWQGHGMYCGHCAPCPNKYKKLKPPYSFQNCE